MSPTWVRRYRMASRQRGQVLPLFVLALMALMGMAAMVIDVGHWYLLKRQAQNDADAIALAAAAVLPESEAKAAARAQTYHEANAIGMKYTIALISAEAYHDTVEARVTTKAPGTFSQLFGLDEVDVGATARARIGTYTSWSMRMLPWAIDEPSFVWNEELTIKVRPAGQVSPGNFGAVDLVYDDPKKGCQPADGADDYRDLITEDVGACGHEVGDLIEQEPGNMAMTGNAVADRGATKPFDPSTILIDNGNGRYTVTDPNHPNVGVIPIIDHWENGNSSAVKIVGFAFFIITGYDKDTVQGVFVRTTWAGGAECPGIAGGCHVGDYDPTGGISAVQLTG